MDRALAAFGDGGVMRHHQYGRTKAFVQIVNQLQNFHAGRGIQITGGLIGQQDRGINAKRARYRDTLPLASR